MKKLYRLEILIIALFVLSAISTGFNYWYKKKITITPDSKGWSAYVRSDEVNGGRSIVANKSDDNSFAVEFDLVPVKINPFATLIIEPSDKSRINMEWLETVTLKTRYIGDSKHSFVVQMRNYEADYYDSKDHASQKFLEAAFDVDSKEKSIVFERSEFTVPTWWISQKSVKKSDSLAEFDAISSIDISTTMSAQKGGGTLYVDSVEISGHQIRPIVLYQGLLAMWMGAFLLVLVKRLWAAKKIITAQRQKESELLKLNDTLELHTKKLKKMAHYDELTGALNRRGIRDTIFDTVQEFININRVYSVVMIDIDHFKQINDTHGHQFGDDVLKQLTKIIECRLRDSDYFARWGGEEFLILCRGTNSEQANILAQSLRAVLKEMNVGVTCSFGIKEATKENDFKQTLTEADQALYKAKNSGRDQVIVSK